MMKIAVKILILLTVVAVAFLAWPDYERTYTFDCSNASEAFLMQGGECPVNISYDPSTGRLGGGIRLLQDKFCPRNSTINDSNGVCFYTQESYENRTIPVWTGIGIIGITLLTASALFLPLKKIVSLAHPAKQNNK